MAAEDSTSPELPPPEATGGCVECPPNPPKECGYCTSEDPGVIGWVRAHQNGEGYVCPESFARDSNRVGAARFGNLAFGEKRLPDSGIAEARVEATALTLLAIVGAGYDHKEGEYKNLCRKMLGWLIAQQQEDGCIGRGRGAHLREHALATMALAETYGLSGDRVVKPRAEKALQYLLDGRSARGGWAEEYRGNAPDCISTALAVAALKSGLMAAIEFDCKEAFAEAGAFLDRLVDGSPGARRVRYAETQVSVYGPDGAWLPHVLPLCEAAYVVAKLFTHTSDLKSPIIKEFSALLVRPENLPAWEPGRVDMLYWWFGTMAAFQVGAKSWETWEPVVGRTLLDNQRGYSAAAKAAGETRHDVDEHGSWDAVDAWNSRTGRVGSTAMAALTLQIYYRYIREIKSGDSPNDESTDKPYGSK